MTKKKTTTDTTKKASITGDHFTLEQVAAECIGLQTEQEMLSAKKGTISDHFMDAAKMYITDKPDGQPMAKDHPFMQACIDQEALSKSSAAGVNQWDKTPANWSQMKSNIKQAYNKGIDINGFETESKMRATLNEVRKAERAAKVDEVDQVEQALTDATEGLSPELSQRIFAIVQICKDMDEKQQDDALRILDDSLENIMVMKELVAQFQQDAEQVA
jgi:hypothetical protein